MQLNIQTHNKNIYDIKVSTFNADTDLT